tara:strand:+ start:704 stop:898 length:195 start_codon:yes stop_codon:yes gene_type:complete
MSNLYLVSHPQGEDVREEESALKLYKSKRDSQWASCCTGKTVRMYKLTKILEHTIEGEGYAGGW